MCRPPWLPSFCRGSGQINRKPKRDAVALSNCLFGTMQAALAAKLLEEEWPDQAETAAARLAEREAATPVPERVWALRNVASTLVRPRVASITLRELSTWKG